MYNRERVGIVETIDNLFKISQSLDCREPAAVDEKVKEFAAFYVFEHQIEFLVAFVHVVYSHDVRVIHEFHHGDLSIDAETLFLRLGLLRSERSTGVD